MKDVSGRQLGFAVFAALAAPVALLSAALPWSAVLLGVGAALLMLLPQGEQMPWMRGVYLIWILLLMAKVASMSRACFEDETGFIPLVLLALAAVAAKYGAEVAGRIGALLWVSVAVLLATLMASAAVDLKWDKVWLAGGETKGWMTACAVMLTPGVLRAGSASQRSGLRWGCLMAALLGVGVSVVACGVLGGLQGVVPQPLYNMVKGVSILGVAERLEALLSVVLCMSCFIALALLCAVGKEYLPGAVKGAAWWVAIAALLLSASVDVLPEEVWMAGGTLVGVIMPGLGDLRPAEKKIEKAKNKC